jgi:hypothetical protein
MNRASARRALEGAPRPARVQRGVRFAPCQCHFSAGRRHFSSHDGARKGAPRSIEDARRGDRETATKIILGDGEELLR